MHWRIVQGTKILHCSQNVSDDLRNHCNSTLLLEFAEPRFNLLDFQLYDGVIRPVNALIVDSLSQELCKKLTKITSFLNSLCTITNVPIRNLLAFFRAIFFTFIQLLYYRFHSCSVNYNIVYKTIL